jgi:hypothetical protein
MRTRGKWPVRMMRLPLSELVMPPPSADLRNRRMALGASEELMAAGMGLGQPEIREIESGAALDEALDHYADWLARMEAWSPEERERQYLRARLGRLFTR